MLEIHIFPHKDVETKITIHEPKTLSKSYSHESEKSNVEMECREQVSPFTHFSEEFFRSICKPVRR